MLNSCGAAPRIQGFSRHRSLRVVAGGLSCCVGADTTQVVVETFPTAFRDEATRRGGPVSWHARAQLLTAQVRLYCVEMSLGEQRLALLSCRAPPFEKENASSS